MSIEQSLERIAVALEQLANPIVNVAIPDPGTQTPPVPPAPAAVPVDVLPGEEAPVATGVTLGAATIKTGAELRDYVGKHLTAAEKKNLAQDLVTFVRDTVCKKFAPKEPKLVNIPEKNLAEAAQMVYDWCAKHQIVVG